MMRKGLPLRIIASLLLFCVFNSHALSALEVSNSTIPLLKASTLGAVVPHCFSAGSHPQIRPTNLEDCKSTLRRLIHQPGFNDLHRFSRNHRRGIQVPIGWRSGNCVIFLSCENDYDADDFRYADIARSAKWVIDQCVDLPEGKTSWGGVNSTGNPEVGSFYVSINSRPVP